MFIFDGVNRKIIIDSTVAAMKQVLYGKTWYMMDAVDLYSEWKRWVVQGDGSQFPPAFSVLGGEDIGGGMRVGSYIFLLVSNGYVVTAPNENDIVVQIMGNLYPDIANYPVIEPWGSNSFSLIMRNSSLTQTVVVSSGSGLSSEQDSILRNVAKESTLTSGVKKMVGLQSLELFTK